MKAPSTLPAVFGALLLTACGGRSTVLSFEDAAPDDAAADAAEDGGEDTWDSSAFDATLAADGPDEASSPSEDASDGGVRADGSDARAPLDASDATAPIDVPDANLPVDASDAGPPTDAADSSLPVDASDASTSADAADSSSPLDAADAGPPGDASADAGPACDPIKLSSAPASLITSVTAVGVQNVPAAVTPDGSAILIQRQTFSCTTGLSLFIADESAPGSGTYSVLPITTLSGMAVDGEEAITLTPDGLTVVGLNTTLTGFVTAARSGSGKADFATSPNAFAAIQATGSQKMWGPALSPDGLAFYYSVVDDPSSSVNGMYESVRASTAVSFPVGVRMPGVVQSLGQYVTAVSTDRLTLFLEESASFATAILTRPSLSDPFTNPIAPSSPQLAPGFRTRPIDGCAGLVGTCQPSGGGCAGEEICVWAPQ